MKRGASRKGSKVQDLAEERTLLARERTMLAYFRTAFAALIFSLVIMRLFLTAIAYSIGVAGIIAAVIFFLIGFHHFPHRKNK